ncbi:MAG TPA: hypothetical protein VG916_05310 [Gemmatimonadaceae bacterium]|nr:hypothetical protein [Gemmatimonadaceae bacterium]
MIRRSPLGRAASLVLAAWFTVFAAEPMALHECPMHSMHAATPHAGMAGMVGMADMGNGAAPAANTPASGHKHATCTCLGGCCAASAVATPATREVSVVEVAVPAMPAFPAVGGVRRPAADFALPFANGPPAAA